MQASSDPKGNLFIVSGPSGAGKGTLVRALMARMPGLWLSVSATTRKPRPGEIEGTHYFFLDEQSFEDKIAQGGFLEWAEVHGNRYGTLRSVVEEKIDQNVQVILEIDPQGAQLVKRVRPDSILIFVEAPSIDELKNRLVSRGSETPEEIDVRMATALREMELAGTYDHVVMNDDLDSATDRLTCIIRAQAEND